MTAGRRLAAMLAAAVDLREHQDGTSENTPTAACRASKHACSSAAIMVAADRE
jgi:hypothetical protein